MKGFEPPTPSLPWRCSTPELHWLLFACQSKVRFMSKLSGRRDSNPRPSAWKADALPTELLPPISSIKQSSGGGRIRTYSAEALDLQSSPPLQLWRTPSFLAKESLWTDSNRRPADYKSAALAN